MDDEQDLGMDEENELDDLGESGSGEGQGDAPPATDNDGSEPESQRINDLMSNWQREQARANRLQAKLDEIEGRKTNGNRRTSKKADSDLDEFRSFAREDARQRLFNSDPRFAKYGVEASAITGDTIAEMQESFNRQRSLMDSLESRIRGEVLAEHGLDAGIGGGGGTQKLPDFGTMSDEDFQKLIERRSQF